MFVLCGNMYVLNSGKTCGQNGELLLGELLNVELGSVRGGSGLKSLIDRDSLPSQNALSGLSKCRLSMEVLGVEVGEPLWLIVSMVDFDVFWFSVISFDDWPNIAE